MSSKIHSCIAGLNRDSKGNQLCTYVPLTSLSIQLCSFLFRRGWIGSYSVAMHGSVNSICVMYKYNRQRSSFIALQMYCTIGQRRYCTIRRLQHLCARRRRNMYFIVSTSKGFISGSEAIALGVGGELIARVIF